MIEIPIATMTTPKVGRAEPLNAADCSSDSVIVPVAGTIRETTDKCCTIKIAATIARPLAMVAIPALC